MPSAHDVMQMQRRAQRVSEASGSRAYDAQTSSLRCHKRYLDANLTLKVWTLVVSTRLQSRLAMPRWSKPAASLLSKLPLGPLKVAEATGMASEATWQRRTASGPRWPYAGAAGGQEPTDRQPCRTSIFGSRAPILTFVVRVMEIISQ